jgi:formate-dependent nitrite reductase cytochrome c552 subunit
MNTRPSLAAWLLCTTVASLPTTGRAAVDPYPNACVSCHVVMKEKGQDERLSVALKAWTAGKVEPGLLAQSKATAPAGVTLKGKHPPAEDSVEDIPAACLDCHDAASKKAPPFSRLLHLVHLTGGVKNVYVTTFKSDCTNCHKLDAKTGEWSIPSGPEK